MAALRVSTHTGRRAARGRGAARDAGPPVGGVISIEVAAGIVVEVIDLDDLMMDRPIRATDGTPITLDEAIRLLALQRPTCCDPTREPPRKRGPARRRGRPIVECRRLSPWLPVRSDRESRTAPGRSGWCGGGRGT